MRNKSYNSRSSLMDCKSNLLFPDWETMPRKTITQSTFEADLLEFSPSIVSAIELGMSDLSNFCAQYPLASRKRNVRATNLNAFVIQQLTAVNGLKLGEITGNGRRSFIEIGDNRLFPKKIDNLLRPSYISTKTVRMYHNQETIDVEDDLPITYLGYQVDNGWTHITGVYAVHMEGNKIEWYTDIVNLAYKNQVLHRNTTQDIDVSVKKDLRRKRSE